LEHIQRLTASAEKKVRERLEGKSIRTKRDAASSAK
jgi:hypothetical protein